MRLLVTGDRNWSYWEFLRDSLDSIDRSASRQDDPIEAVIEGECHTLVNADKMAAKWGAMRGIFVECYPADWKQYHRAAGPIRNQEMLTKGLPTNCAAFHNDLPNSSGTLDMVRRCLRAEIPVVLFRVGLSRILFKTLPELKGWLKHGGY